MSVVLFDYYECMGHDNNNGVPFYSLVRVCVLKCREYMNYIFDYYGWVGTTL